MLRTIIAAKKISADISMPMVTMEYETPPTTRAAMAASGSSWSVFEHIRYNVPNEKNMPAK
jgi:hypothetical protein